MALIRFAEGQQRSGSTGGSVYSHNRFGQYIRSRSTPVNPNTDRQVAVRNAVRALTIAWQSTLTQVQRDAWDVYAANVVWTNKFGDAVHLTGLNHYVRSNTPRVQHGIGRVDAAPTIFNLATAEQALTGSASEATQQVTCGYDDTAPWAAETGAYQWMYVGLPRNAAIKFFGGPYRYGLLVIGLDAIPPPSPLVIPTPFPFAEGNRIWVRTRIGRADGRLSDFAQVNFLGAA